jgi:hypothetical protein
MYQDFAHKYLVCSFINQNMAIQKFKRMLVLSLKLKSSFHYFLLSVVQLKLTIAKKTQHHDFDTVML